MKIRILFIIAILAVLVSCKQKPDKIYQNQNTDNNICKGIINKDSSALPKITILTDSNKPKPILAGKVVRVQNPFGDGQGAPTFVNYGTEDGLALSSIKCGYLDSKGNLWFGTYGGGVSRYDGKSFTNYSTAQGLANNSVLCIKEDKKGNLWFGTYGGGANCFDGKSFKTYTKSDGLANNIVYSITEDKSGNLWFGILEGGASRYDGKTFTTFSTRQGLANNSVLSITEDKSGLLWFGTDGGGVSRFDGKSFTNYSTTEGLVGNSVLSIAEDAGGNMWFGTEYNGVCCFDGKNFTNYKTKEGLAGNTIHCITKDKEGNLWFGTGNGGVSRYNGKSFTNYSTANGLANNWVYSITEDNSGNLWFGTNGGGVNRYDGKSFAYFTVLQGLANDMIYSIAEDKEGNIWFATDGGGASRYDGKSFVNYSMSHGLPSNSIINVTVDRTGKIWLGTNGGGISCFDGKHFTNYTTTQGLINNVVRTMKEDRAGRLWIGTDGGVSCFDGKSFTNYTTAQGLANKCVYCITQDRKGNLWFGTYGGGVSCFDGTHFTNYTKAQGLANNVVRSIIEDKKGNLWLGTNGGGVSCFNGKSFTSYTTADGLADDCVYAISEDTLNNTIWIGTNLGLSGLQVNKKLNADGSKYTFENFNNKTGYPIKDLNTNAIFIDRKGILWAGCGDSKVIRFDYKSLNKNTHDLKLQIQSIAINNQKLCWYSLKKKNNPEDSLAVVNEMVTSFGRSLSSVEQEKMIDKFRDIQFDSITKFYPLPTHLVLPYKHNNISFEFAAIEPAMGNQVKYQYILEGYDKNWSELGSRTNASFGNIHEGSYTFRIKALCSSGVWGETSYSFEVLPPWWRTWWAYFLYIVSTIVILYTLYRWRTASLRREKEVLEIKVKDRTVEVVQQKENAENQRIIAEEQRKKSDDLLLNILPAEIAEELKTAGFSKARLYNHVSVIFTDFVNFTEISSNLNPSELVAEIDRNFKAFDRIVEKHKIEKIKTIGDAYMAVCGLPIETEDHAERAVRAAIDIRDFIVESRKSGGLFDIRIGIHTGAVVAGIVGIKKFAYDIWGDTVNTASRMEANSVPNKVNISGSCHELVKDMFRCEYRGKIEAKGKGDIDMYFVEDTI